MRNICNHCNSVIPSGAAHEWRGWVDQSTQAYCDSVFIDCPLCGSVSVTSIRMEAETSDDRDFLAFAEEQLGLLAAGKSNVFTAALS